MTQNYFYYYPKKSKKWFLKRRLKKKWDEREYHNSKLNYCCFEHATPRSSAVRSPGLSYRPIQFDKELLYLKFKNKQKKKEPSSKSQVLKEQIIFFLLLFFLLSLFSPHLINKVNKFCSFTINIIFCPDL